MSFDHLQYSMWIRVDWDVELSSDKTDNNKSITDRQTIWKRCRFVDRPRKLVKMQQQQIDVEHFTDSKSATN